MIPMIPVARSLRSFFALTLALGTIGAAALIEAPPVEAKKMSCLQKYRGCQVRCGQRYDLASPGWYSCHDRTCAHQFDNCG
jgi:hypothetical protein